MLGSPFSYESGGAWRRAACRALEVALGAEASSFALPGIKGEDFFEGPSDVVTALQAIIPPPEWVNDGLILRRGKGISNVADWTELFDADAVRRTPFYNDVVRPCRLLAPVVMMADIADGQLPATLTLYYDDESRATPYAERRKQMLTLLAPAFSAGVRAYLACRTSVGFLTLAEFAQIGVMLIDENLHPLYENRFLSELRSRDPEHERIRTVVKRVADAVRVLARHGSRSSEPPLRTMAEVRTSTAAYRVSATAMEQIGAGERTTILALVEYLSVKPLESPELATKFHLTPREIEVSRLVRAGRSSREIAIELRISRNTARRHIENLFMKLDVHTRTAAASLLSGH